jgi:hypothetical protein
MGDIGTAIEKLRRKSTAAPDIAPLPTREQLQEAEAKLKTRFPPSFLQFLQEAGACQLPFWQTYWVGDDSLGLRNIVAANEQQRQAQPPLPCFLIAFHNNGCGDQLCFDIRRPSKEGEYPVVFWDREASLEDNLSELFVVADDFADWLEQEVEVWFTTR